MKIAFVINDLEHENPKYTTTLLALEALRRGHQVIYVPVDSFSRGAGDSLAAHAWLPSGEAADGQEALIHNMRATAPYLQALDDLDVMMLRNDPADDATTRPWARLAAVDFARFAVEAGVLVLNDPDGLMHHVNKLSLEHYPPEIRPRALVSRDMDEIRAFVESHDGPTVLKPLAGSGGRNVFFVRKKDHPNLKQIVAAIQTEGFVLAQESVPEAAEGDIRLFLMNGSILEADGVPALMRRHPEQGESRSNIRQGAIAEPFELSDNIRNIAETVRPRIIADGLFLVGLDIAGPKVLELNVFSPGGFGSIEKVTGVNFASIVINDIERKVRHRKSGRTWSNALLNTI